MFNFKVIYILWLRQLKRYVRNKARVIGAVGQPLLFLIALGFGLGAAVNQSGDVDYFNFLVPGVVGMSILFSSVFTGMELIGDRQFGFLKETFVAPVSRFNILLGKALGGATVSVLQGGLVLVLAFLIGFDPAGITLAGLAITFTAACLIGILFSTFGLVLASNMRDTSAFPLVINFIMFPLFFLSGALYPLNNLPPAMEFVTKINPFTYGVDAMRYGLGIKQAISIFHSFGILILLIAILLAVGSWVFSKVQIES